MTETKNFSDRLDAALAMNDLDNVTFAAHFGPNGQQLVNRWRFRGKVGQPSVPKVRDLLRRTNIDWLQEGKGPHERLSADLNTSQRGDVRQSYAARLDVHMLAKALGVLEAAEFRNGQKFRALDAATRLMGYYDRLATGVKQADLIAHLFDNDDQGSDHAQPSEDAGAGKNGR